MEGVQINESILERLLDRLWSSLFRRDSVCVGLLGVPTMKRKPLTKVQRVLAKSSWYRRPTLASLAKGHKSEAAKVTEYQWSKMKLYPEDYGIHFPYREFKISHGFPQVDFPQVETEAA